MSGTSGDGVDASLIRSDGITNYEVLKDRYFEYDKDIFEDIHKLKEKILKKLKSLLTSDMASSFEEAIKQRQSNNIKSELTFIGIKETNLEKFERVKNNFFATVKFVSEIISVKRDKDNKIIEGNPDKIKVVTDHWKFTKTTISQNPNWYLSEIVGK